MPKTILLALLACLPAGAATTSWTDPVLTANTTKVRSVHVQELRTAIDAKRASCGMSAYSWTDPVILSDKTLIRKVHIDELRASVNAIYAKTAQTPPSFTDPILVARTTPIRAIHISEIRSAVDGATCSGCPSGFAHISPSPYGGAHACIIHLPHQPISLPNTVSAHTILTGAASINVTWTGAPYYCPDKFVASGNSCVFSFTMNPALLAASVSDYSSWAPTDGTVGFTWDGHIYPTSSPDPCPAGLTRGSNSSGDGFCTANLTAVWNTSGVGSDGIPRVQFDIFNPKDPGFGLSPCPSPLSGYGINNGRRCSYNVPNPFSNPYGPPKPITVIDNFNRYSTKTIPYATAVLGFTY